MLKIEDVSMTFNENTPDEKKALQRINLELEKGEFVTVIGSNGAGKSTLMNVISGSLIPDVGDVYINDQNVVHLPEYKRSKMIGRVFQDPMAGTAPSMTIEENLAMAYARDKKRKLVPGVNKKRKDHFREYLETLNLGLEDRLNAKVGFLSGGERQALSLLMATFTEPYILLLDEHTAALDPSRAELITKITKDVVAKFGLTTMMVTHNMQQALDLGDRLFMMDKGQIIFDIKGEEKQNLTIKNLLDEFQRIRGKQIESDRAVLG
ncbi:ABC transporter ATP-binding protein [Piscibacillus halophilus]|uniref:Putative ABC transport system ATP-binding protein n=1 Tax=Piscibacillus halophilus TaxID=571933 RepID=A0A1H9JQQ3_9BACI|nr:ABC transporter ATP-binding protein [Piscibacillus halophilus]SEQ89167.1 putative ABC transport system ATP-binding protein [Piscibacillus halophilus]